MVWFILAGMAAFAGLAAVWPVLRGSSRSADADAASSDAAFYKAQIDEIERDVERGQLPRSEADAARAEAARRLIATRSDPPKAASSRTRNRLAAAVLIAAGVPAIAFPLYLGSAARRCRTNRWRAARPRPMPAGDIDAAVAAVEAHLIAKPDDGKGWAVLAPVYMRLERYDDAAHAYSEALHLLGEDPSRRAAYGESARRCRRRRRHRQGAPGLRQGGSRRARPAAGALLSRARRRAGRQHRRGHQGLRVAGQRTLRRTLPGSAR